MIGRLDLDPSRRLDLPITVMAGASGVLMRSRDRGVHTDIPGDQPGGVRASLQLGQDARPDPVALPPAEQPVHAAPIAVLTKGSERSCEASLVTTVKHLMLAGGEVEP
jgi:hypothetical protein